MYYPFIGDSYALCPTQRQQAMASTWMRGKHASPCTWDFWGSQYIKYCVHVSPDYCNFNFMYYYMHVLTVLHSCIIIQCTDINYDICFMRSLFQNTHLFSILRYFWYFNSSNGSNNNNKNKNISNTTKNNICNNNIEYWIPVTSTNNSALNLVALRQLVGVENGELSTRLKCWSIVTEKLISMKTWW